MLRTTGVFAGACAFFLLIGLSAAAQNTKGDRPAASNKKETRDVRFKTKKRKVEKAKTKDIAGRKLRTKNKSSANRANVSYPTPRTASRSPRVGKERTGKAVGRVTASTPRSSEQSYSGRPPRKRVEVRSATARVSKSNVYQFRTPPRSVSARVSKGNVYSGRLYRYANNAAPRPRDNQKAYTRTAYGTKVKVRSSTAEVKKQNLRTSSGGQYRNFRSSVVQKPVSNRTEIARIQRLTKSPATSPRRKVTVTPRSASRSFIRTKSINPYAGFFRVKRKGEQATGKDLAGHTLTKRNYHSPPIGIVVPEQDPYRGRKRVGDRAYRGPAAGRHKSATRTQPKAWVGDIAGRKIRGKNFVSTNRASNAAVYPPKLGKPRVGDHPRFNKLRGGGFRSFTSEYVGKVGLAIPVKNPGKKANKLGRYQHRLTGIKPVKGGGSAKGSWNNQGRPIGPSKSDARGVEFSGSIKTGRPYKGGGSVSGRVWNNNGRAISPSKADARGVEFSGNVKTGKPIKGGGSVSGQVWNNQGRPIGPSRSDARGIDFAGTIKGGKPVKGGGSVSGRVWNNQGQPIGPSRSDARGIDFAGAIKTGKPVKGGGSVSGRVWNNQGRPIGPSRSDARGVDFAGNIKAGKPVKGGGSVSGSWNNDGKPIGPSKSDARGVDFAGNIKPKRIVKSAADIAGFPGKFKKIDLVTTMVNQGEEFTGFIKQRKYKHSLYQHGNALEKKHNKMANSVGGLHVAVKQPGWARNPYSHKDALLKRDPGGNVFKTEGLQVRVGSPGYEQNKAAHPSSISKRKQAAVTFRVNDLTSRVKQPGWARNKNAHEDAQLKRDPGSYVFRPDGLQVRVKSPAYRQNENAHKASLLKVKPSPQTFVINGLTAKVKQPGWARNKNAHDDAMLKRDPGTSVFRTQEIYGRVKVYPHKANPSASKLALPTREPGRAFAKAVNYQGNIKMQKFNFLKHPDYHPDASFVKNNKNNVKEERSLLTNIRLFWAKVFRKNETQPDVVKEKVRKPRYDRRDVGLWYD